MFSGILGLLVLIADIWAIFNIVQSKESGVTKIIWVIVVLVLPAVGFIIWYFAGPKPS